MSSKLFDLDPHTAERVLDLALGEQRIELQRKNAVCDLRTITGGLIAVVLAGDSSRARRMNHAQIISCIAYIVFFAAPVRALARPHGYDFPKSPLCFAAGWWEDEHLGVAVTITEEEHHGARVTTAWPLDAAELFPREGVKMDELASVLQAMLQGLVDAANLLLVAVRGESLSG